MARPDPKDDNSAGNCSDESTSGVLRLVRRHGWNATSYQILQRGFEYFFDGDDACVGYVDTGHAWVAAGAPLCDPGRLADVVATFVAAAKLRDRRVCFFATESPFVGAVPLRSLLIGEQGVWNPALWEGTLGRTRSLREQLRRARSKGVRVRATLVGELSDPSSPAALAVLDLIRRWRSSHGMAPMGFLVDVNPLSMGGDHRLYVAERAGEGDSPPSLVGFLAASPVFARRGWLLQAVVRAPDAPNGTAELLIDRAMRAAASDDDAFVTLGLAPLAGSVALPLRWARAACSLFFDFKGLWWFKAKLRPQRWDAVHLSFPFEQGVARSLIDVLTAFAHGHPLRFALRTLLRRPASLVSLR